jgi:hypothetical protein
MWFNLSAAQGNNTAEKNRDIIAERIATAVGLQTDEIETKFLHANSILEFSHSLGPQAAPGSEGRVAAPSTSVAR